MTLQNFFLFLHVLGIVLWVGLAIALPFVTGRAARTGELPLMAFAYGVAARLTRTLGLTGMLLTVIGGYGLNAVRGYPYFQPFPKHWLFQMQLLGTLTFLVAVGYQVPLSARLAREAERSAAEGALTPEFETARKRNAIVGSLVGLVLLVVIGLGALKP